MPPHALILVEGETEIEFLRAIAESFFPRYPKTVRNLCGSFSVNRKVVDRVVEFHHRNPSLLFFVCVFLDRERTNLPEFNLGLVTKKLTECSIDVEIVPVITNLMSESLFFADIEGIYSHLRAPHAKRNHRKFSNFRTLTYRDLAALFRQHDKVYVKGRRAGNLISDLNIRLIVSRCEELQLLVARCN